MGSTLECGRPSPRSATKSGGPRALLAGNRGTDNHLIIAETAVVQRLSSGGPIEMNVQALHNSPLAAHASPAAAGSPPARAAGPRVDRDGDTDNSTPASDAAEAARAGAARAAGIGRILDATA